MKQRSNEWRKMRLGDVTMSRAGDVLSKPSATGVFSVNGERGQWNVWKDGQIVAGTFQKKADATERQRELVAEWAETHWSATAESYLNELLSELIHCTPGDVWRSDATDWGTAQEPHAFELAVPAIEQHFGETLSMPVDDFAYVHHPTEPHIGCSPDGILGDDGLAEIKCPYNGTKWIAAYRNGLTLPKEYVPQVQGQLWVTGREWCAFCYFDPRVQASGLDPLLVTKVHRDDDYIENTLAPRVLAFRDLVRAEYHKMVGEKEPF